MRTLLFGRLLAATLVLVAVALSAVPQSSAEPPAQAGAQGAPSGAAATPQTPPCPIVANPPGADFGVVEPGTVVSATIKLTNPLSRPVTVIKATPSCTCTTIDMEGKTLPAGGTIEMPMSMKTSRSVGKKAAMVTLVFDGVPVPLVVRIDAETAYAVRANPPFIDALAPERMKGFFELLSVDGQPFSVKSVDGKPAQSADGSPMKPSSRQVVKYDLTSPGLHRSVPPFLVVETDHPKCPILDLRVRHETTRISPALNFAEFRENIGLVENGKPVEFEVQLKHAGQLRVDRALSNNTSFEARLLDQKSDGDSLLVRVQLVSKGISSGPFLFTCTLSAGAKSSDLWIYGSGK